MKFLVCEKSLVYICTLHISRSTQPGHPSVLGAMSTSKSRDVNRHTTRCTSPVSVVSQCKLVSGWGLRKQRSAPPCGPCTSGWTLRLCVFTLCTLPVQTDDESKQEPESDSMGLLPPAMLWPGAAIVSSSSSSSSSSYSWSSAVCWRTQRAAVVTDLTSYLFFVLLLINRIYMCETLPFFYLS